MKNRQKRGSVRMWKTPFIGVMPIYDKVRGNAWMLNQYFEAILQVGGIPVMLPLTDDRDVIYKTVKKLDGFLFTGGDDVDPFVYQEENTYSVDVYLQKDKMECKYITTAIEMEKPVFGICRGLQIMNVALGGSLFQDLRKENQDRELENHRQEIPRDQSIHQVTVTKSSLLHSILKKERFGVNSLHHQSVKKLAGDLSISAIADDGIVEAVEIKEHPFALAVQWHPELRFLVDEDSLLLFKAFIDAARSE